MRPSQANAPTERALIVQEQLALGVDKCSPCNHGSDFSRLAINPFEPAAKSCPDDAFLDPGLAFGQFAIGSQASQLGAGTCPARRAVVCFARAQNKASRLRS